MHHGDASSLLTQRESIPHSKTLHFLVCATVGAVRDAGGCRHSGFHHPVSEAIRNPIHNEGLSIKISLTLLGGGCQLKS